MRRRRALGIVGQPGERTARIVAFRKTALTTVAIPWNIALSEREDLAMDRTISRAISHTEHGR